MSSIFHAPTLEADPTAETEVFDSFAVADAYVEPVKPVREVRTLHEPPEIWDLVPEAKGVAPAEPVREVRTLHEPPEIWDLVPEAPKRFNRSSALFVRVTSFNPLILALLVVLGGGGAVFGYMNWGSWSGLIRAASSLLEEPGSKTTLSLRAPVSEKRAAPSEQPRVAASPIVTNTKKAKVAATAIEPSHPIAEIAAAPVLPTAEPVAAPVAVPEKSSATKPRRTSVTSSEPVLTRAPSKVRAQLTNKSVEKSDDERRANTTVTKHPEEKTQGPAPSAPARATSIPKGKVIQWP